MTYHVIWKNNLKFIIICEKDRKLLLKESFSFNVIIYYMKIVFWRNNFIPSSKVWNCLFKYYKFGNNFQLLYFENISKKSFLFSNNQPPTYRYIYICSMPNHSTISKVSWWHLALIKNLNQVIDKSQDWSANMIDTMYSNILWVLCH